MSQNYVDNVYQPDFVIDTTMSNVDDNFDALKSSFSGTNAPSNQVAGQLWMKTVGNVGFRYRNYNNTAWEKILTGDANQKMWVYRNDTAEGWLIDATVTDRVLAIKGGSQAYNTAGGTNAGTWTQPSHTLTTAQMPVHSHSAGLNNTPHDHTIRCRRPGTSGNPSIAYYEDVGTFRDITIPTQNQDHTHSISSEGGSDPHNHGTTYRPAAAVGTLQYPDLG